MMSLSRNECKNCDKLFAYTRLLGALMAKVDYLSRYQKSRFAEE